jgi:hypothetical protein
MNTISSLNLPDIDVRDIDRFIEWFSHQIDVLPNLKFVRFGRFSYEVSHSDRRRLLEYCESHGIVWDREPL